MKPKEKAKELYDSMFDRIFDISPKHNLTTYKRRQICAKECAMIAIDEIEKVGCWISKECAEKEGFDTENTEEFWQDVRIELHSL